MSGLPWFRLFSEARTDAKLRTLADDEHRVWFALLCYAAEQGERGSIPPGDAFLLAIEVAAGDEELLGRTLSKLVRLRILNEDGDGGYVFASFMKRQYDKPSDRPERVTERVRKHRASARTDETPEETQGNAGNADETPSNAIEESREEESRGENSPPVEVPPDEKPDEGVSVSPLSQDPEPATVIPEEPEKPKAAANDKPVRPVPKPRPHQLPKPFEITDEMWEIADQNGWDRALVRFETDKFIDHYGGSGKPMVDWVAVWRNWMRRVPQFEPGSRKGRASPSGPQPFSARSELARLEAAS